MSATGFGHRSTPGKPPGRRERKKLETRRRIFRAAIELFMERGFDATTVEEIAERADVGKGTVFNYFPQKTTFLVAAYQEWVGRMEEDLGPLESWEGPARAQLGRVFGYLTDLSVRHRALARQVIFENMRQAHLRITERERKARESISAQAEGENAPPGGPDAVRLLEDIAGQVIRQGKSRSQVRPEVDVDQAASLVAAAAFHTLVRGLVRAESAAEIEAHLAAKLDIIFTGLTP